MKVMRWIFGVLILIALSPVIFMLTAGIVARLAGCKLNEGSVNPCIVLGGDIGATLYAATVSAWFAMASLPVGALVAAVWIVIEIIAAIRRWMDNRRRARPV